MENICRLNDIDCSLPSCVKHILQLCVYNVKMANNGKSLHNDIVTNLDSRHKQLNLPEFT